MPCSKDWKKRKAAKDVREYRSRPATAAENVSETRSILLDLPAELRNLVYEYVTESITHVTLHDGHPVPQALAHVSQQTRKEFLPIYMVIKGTRITHLTSKTDGFDFGPTTDFLDTLQSYSKDKKTTQSIKVTIRMYFTAAPGMEIPDVFPSKGFFDWMKRCIRQIAHLQPYVTEYKASFDGDQVDGILLVQCLPPMSTSKSALSERRKIEDAVFKAAKAELDS